MVALLWLSEVAEGKWAVTGWIPHGPKLGKNWSTLAAAFTKGFGVTLGQLVGHFIFMAIFLAFQNYLFVQDITSFIPVAFPQYLVMP